jgi:Peptidase MA superfamily/Domain of unknown function (DUF4124)
VTRRIACWTLSAALWAALSAGVALADNYVWVDEDGVTHISNDPERVPEAVRERRHDSESLRALWNGPVGSAEGGPKRTPDLAEQRTQRALRAAVEDLQRGENGRAAAQLRAILREQPGRPEPHWYLALLDRHRGRYESAQEHLEAFLATAGDDLERWRSEARSRLAALADERRLLEGSGAADAGPWPELSSPHFRVQLDPDLHAIAPDYAVNVMSYLEEARLSAVEHLGTQPEEPMGVVFYGRAAYDAAHSDRFSFRTVGFFDGKIHVVSAAHPAGELRSLLFHEYTHAVFRDRTGGDRPYWLNEGMAELSERASRDQPGLTRSERLQLKRRLDGGEWLSLRRLSPSFGGLEDDDARVAYLESTAAAQWLLANSDPEGRARLLDRLGSGASADEALVELLGMDMTGVDAAVQSWIQSEFAGRLPRPARLD